MITVNTYLKYKFIFDRFVKRGTLFLKFDPDGGV